MYFLGYDIGSSTIKVALVDSQSMQEVGLVQYPDTEMDIVSRQQGWAEQQPEFWWRDFCMATRKLLHETGVDPGDIEGIGIAYQMHGLVLVDENYEVLRPSIIWCDSRAVAIGRQAFKEITPGYCLENLLNSPGNFTASRLKWVKDNEPEIYSRIHRMLLPGDYIAMKLTGETATTISGLSEGIFWNFKEKEIDQRILNYFDLDEGHLPEVVPTFSVQGKVTETAAGLTGLRAGIPVTYRAGDQPNNALALNVLNPGEIAATSGTSGVVYGIVDKLIFDPKSRVNAFAHVNYEDRFDRIGILLCINGAGIQYSWMKQQIARSGRKYDDMERMASSIPVGSDGLCILPFGNGAERILENRTINSHIFNLQFNRHSRGNLYRAALEGVAFSFVYGVNILKEMGLEVDIIRVGNDNMFRSKVFSSTISTMLGCQIDVLDTTGAVGAARAAGVAAGAYNSIHEAFSGIRARKTFEPDLDLAQTRQAYNYWLTCLEKVTRDRPSNSPGIGLLRAKNDDLNRTLVAKNKELAATNMHLAAKDDLLIEIRESLKSLTNLEGDAGLKRELSRLSRKVDSSIGENRERNILEERLELVQDDFLSRLKARFPTLSMAEMKLCGLLRLNLSTKEIADQLNLSVRGVETRRYRLRKKLGLKKKDNLIFFLESAVRSQVESPL